MHNILYRLITDLFNWDQNPGCSSFMLNSLSREVKVFIQATYINVVVEKNCNI
jgi:hypothetical protein